MKLFKLNLLFFPLILFFTVNSSYAQVTIYPSYPNYGASYYYNTPSTVVSGYYLAPTFSNYVVPDTTSPVVVYPTTTSTTTYWYTNPYDSNIYNTGMSCIQTATGTVCN